MDNERIIAPLHTEADILAVLRHINNSAPNTAYDYIFVNVESPIGPDSNTPAQLMMGDIISMYIRNKNNFCNVAGAYHIDDVKDIWLDMVQWFVSYGIIPPFAVINSCIRLIITMKLADFLKIDAMLLNRPTGKISKNLFDTDNMIRSKIDNFIESYNMAVNAPVDLDGSPKAVHEEILRTFKPYDIAGMQDFCIYADNTDKIRYTKSVANSQISLITTDRYGFMTLLKNIYNEYDIASKLR